MKNPIRFSVKPSEHTKTRIMATVGRKALDLPTLRAMVDEGATFFRFNGAHLEKKRGDDDGQLSYAEAWTIIENIKKLRNERHQLLGVYFDLGGPKIRIQNVLSIDTQPAEDRESWLHPGRNAKVSIRLHDKNEEQKFETAFKEFTGQVADGAKKFWKTEEKIRQFFINYRPSSDRYELMFGQEIKNLDDFSKGGIINLKDGWCRLVIKDIEKKTLNCEVEYRDSKFVFVPHQGANPKLFMFRQIITEKDIRDTKEALMMGADIISLSFVCSPSDAIDLKAIIKQSKQQIRDDRDFMRDQTAIYRKYIAEEHDIPIFAKIETAFAVNYKDSVQYASARGRPELDPTIHDPLVEIADRFDGLMVARGDLAVEVEKYAVPELQRRIIRAARIKNKPVIVATEMLESMKRGNASTRAEISDINTAVHQGADILMLSGETASTEGLPEEAVKEMRNAIVEAEGEPVGDDEKRILESLEESREAELRNKHRHNPDAEELAVSRLSQGAQLCLSARTLKADAVIASAQTGEAVREIAYYRPRQAIIAITENVLTGIRLLQHRGVYPVVMEHPITRTVDEFVEIANQIHREIGIPLPEEVRKKKTIFRLPGLLRIELASAPVRTPPEIPNSLHAFTLPVVPLPTPERERKYVLSQASHDRLAANLKTDAGSWQLLRQVNAYFTDEIGILDRERVTVRLREETVEDSSDSNEETAVGSRKVLLSVKGRGKESSDGTEERPEQEFDVGHDYPSGASLDSLSDGCKEYVANIWRKLLSEHYPSANDASYIRTGSMVNHRLRCSMNNGFELELDRCPFEEATYYELEIEFREGQRLELNEYIHDKFAWLNIPLVTGYPSKLERTYLHAGRLKPPKRAEEVRGKIDTANAAALQEHQTTSCKRCESS